MNRHSLPRRLAALLLRWSERLSPPSRQRWVEGMRNEVHYVEEDWQALRWAFSCLIAAFAGRIGGTDIMAIWVVRVLLLLFLGFKVFDDLFATALTIAYRMGALGAAGGLGAMMPGDDYTRVIPLMEAVPLWLHGLWVTAAALYLSAILLVLLRNWYAYIPLLLALGVEIAATLAGRPIIEVTGVRANPDPSFLAAVVLPYFLPLTLALVLWRAGQKARPAVTP